MSLTGSMRDGKPVSPNEEKHRQQTIKSLSRICPEWVLKSNPLEYMIDINILNHPKFKGIEIEQCNCDEYVSESQFSNFLRNGTPNILFKTLNFPFRKMHFWINGDCKYYSGKYVGEYWYTETNAEGNIFIRTNFSGTQIMIIYPDVILNKSNLYFSSKEASNIKKGNKDVGYVEHWVGIPLELVEIWNYNKEIDEWIKFEYTPPKPLTPNRILQLRKSREITVK